MSDQDPQDSVRLEMTGFARRLQERFGRTADPSISLEPPDHSEEAPHNQAEEYAQTRASKRLKRLENLTPAEFRYEYKGEVGRGGMGVVFKVRDRDLGRHLAMKVVTGSDKESKVPVNQSKLTRFLEEAQITGQLDHPGIVPVHELGMDAHGRCFFTMRLVKGRDFKAVIDAIHSKEPVTDKDLQSWDLTRALRALSRVCETMAFAHSKGVLHRDLKPANIMVGRFGETYVMDWGLAKVQGRDDPAGVKLREDFASISIVKTDRRADHGDDPDSPLMTMDGDVIGTPAYMAPEQARGDVEKMGPQSDVYSIGAILYHMLTGRAPYTEPGERLAPHVVLMKVLAGPPPRLHTLSKGIPVELAAICEKAMAYSRKQRYASVLDLAEDLSAYLEGRVVRAHDTGPIAEFRKWVVRNKPFACALAAALIVLFASLAGISYVTATTNQNLGDKNQELIASQAEAEANAQRAVENERVADAARKDAVRNAEIANRQGYISHVRAANSSLRLDEIHAALGHLALTAGEHAGWERDYLELAADSSLEQWNVPLIGNQVAAITPDGHRFAVVTSEPRHGIQLRATTDGQVIRTFTGHSQSITALAFSADGRFLASAARDRTVRIWNVQSGVDVQLPLIASVEDLAFSPLGRRLAISTKGISPDNGRALIFDLGEGPELSVPQGPLAAFDCEGGVVQCVAFGPRGRRIVTGTAQGLVHIWDLTTQTAVLRKDWTASSVRDVAFAPSGSTFFAATEDGVLRVASTDSGGIVSQRSMDVAVANQCAFLQDGRVLIACNDGNLRLFNPNDASLVGIHGHTDTVSALAVSDLGAIAITGANDGSLHKWSTYSLEASSLVFKAEDDVLALAHHPERNVVAFSTSKGPITLVDTLSGEALSVLRGHREYVPALAFSQSGRWLASGSGDNTVRIWDTARGEIFTVLDGHTKWISDLAFSPEGRYLASTSGDRTVRVWDIEKEECIAVLEGHATWANDLAWNPAGTRIISGDSDGEVLMWDPFRKERVTTFHPSERGIQDLEFAADGQTFFAASLDNNVYVVDVSTGEQRALSEHRQGVAALTLLPDGSRLASADSSGSVVLWDTSDWEALITLRATTSRSTDPLARQVRNLLFTPDGKRLLTTNEAAIRAYETAAPHERHTARLEARSVVGVVDSLFGDFGVPNAVLQSLRDDRNISGKMREAAIRAVTLASGDPDSLTEQAWRILMNEGEEADAYQNALDLAAMAADVMPDDVGVRAALAAGLFRTGDLARAHTEFSALLESFDPNSTRPELPIFAAMTLLALGHVDQASAQLDALREPMTRPAWQARAGALYREAQTLLESLR